MTEMKDSGIEWIGLIPYEWNILRIKNCCKLNGRIGWQGLKSDEFIESGPYLITGTDFERGVINWNKCVHISEERFAEAPEIHVKNGDLLISKDGTVGKVAIAKNAPNKVSLNSGILLIKVSEEVDKEYLSYILVSEHFWLWFNKNQTGNSTILHLYQNKFYEFPFLIPKKLAHQKAIATHLNNECSAIDSTIEKIQKQIELLEEYKRSVITEAVTKGLDPNAPMKDSVVEWIGQIPKHWSEMRIKYLVRVNENVLPESTDKDYRFSYVDIGSVSYTNGIENYEEMTFINAPSRARRLVLEGDIIISTVRTYLRAVADIIRFKDVVVSTGFAVLSAKYIEKKFLKYAVVNEPFIAKIESQSVGVSYPSITAERVVNISIPLPPTSEQNTISERLESVCDYIDRIISSKNQQILKLLDYKKSLIYEYVTGKKQVGVE